MKKIVFATNNQHKLDEIRSILGPKFEIVSLAEIGCHEDIPETGQTLEENALQKAQYVYDHYGMSCFADDTGLEVDALNGAPGVFSARYAGGEGHDSEANMNKLLAELENNNNRRAQFRTVIALILKEEREVESEDGKVESGERSETKVENLNPSALRALSRDKSPARKAVKKVSATTLFFNPTATTKPLPNWAWKLKTISATAPGL